MMGLVNKARREALANGEKTYMGCYERLTSNYACVECRRRKGLEKLNNAQLMAKYKTPEKEAARLKKWRENNYEKYQQQWLKDKDKNNARASKRRAAVRDQIPDDADFEAIKDIYRRCKELCEQSGIVYEVDHIIPIAKGGLHHQDNLQIITRSENRSKGCRVDGEGSPYQ
jgi:5-methylcytosine-specific restriction endonuclease McrA